MLLKHLVLKFGQKFINEGPLVAAEKLLKQDKGAFGDPYAWSSDAQNAFINAISAQAIKH